MTTRGVVAVNRLDDGLRADEAIQRFRVGHLRTECGVPTSRQNRNQRMFLTAHACSYCSRESTWCLGTGHGDQLNTARPEAVWICACCVNDALFPVSAQPRGARCDSCGWRRIGKLKVIIHTSSGPFAPADRTKVDIVRAKAMLVRGGRVLCNYCVDEARRVLASPWLRLGRARWPKADILGDGPFAVVGCDDRRITLWRERRVAEQTSAHIDPLMCGTQCKGGHRVEQLRDDRGGALSRIL
jgi:hypothetical protein